MADDLQSNLNNYKLQLQQVEATLTTDPENEDLKKLKKDLQEVIDLTQDLISSQAVTSKVLPSADNADPVAASDSAAAPPTSATSRQWKVGDRCVAHWSEDQQMYPATVDEVLADGSCTVTFDKYDTTEVTQVSLLRPLEEGVKRGGEEADSGAPKKPKTKRDLMAAEREYKKKKQQKKAQRQKQLEEERETEKNKWLDFNAKAFSKSSKGKVKKSIFASPESVSGRVGVGTCGMSGKPMTDFVHQEKWKK